jgi:Tol biopolymer transport system component/DNA-binding winged helix-turn-helix (wHTH) protein
MGSSGRPNRVVAFGAFQVDLDSGELFNDGLKVRLAEQPFQLLAMLLASPGEVISREDLRTHLWPQNTYVDFDRSLNTATSKLREALRDSADNPVFIQTLPRRGYRFIAPVTALNPINIPNSTMTSNRAPLPESGSGEKSQAAKWVTRRNFARTMVTGAILVLLGWLLVGSYTTPALPKVNRIDKLTNDGRAKNPELATDGVRVYFSEWQDQHWMLAHTPVGGGETELIPTPFIGANTNAAVRGISPDNNHLLVVTGRQRTSLVGYPVWEVSASGSSGRRLGDIVANDGDWSPNGLQFTYATNNQIWICDADGRGSRKVAEVGVLVGYPRWSPEGKRIRFTAAAQDNWERTIWEVDGQGGAARAILPQWKKEQWGGRWTSDGKSFVFNSESNIWVIPDGAIWFSKAASKPLKLTSGPLKFYSPLPSPDGNRLFAIGELKRGDLFSYDLHGRTFTPVMPGLSATELEYSSDGQWILYVTYPEGELWRSRIDGSNRQQLTTKPSIVTDPRWSPNGREIAYFGRIPGGPWKTYVIAIEGGSPQEIAAGSDPQPPSWSADGTQMVLGSPKPGPAGLGVLDMQTGKLSRLPDSIGLIVPKWSPDGRYISARRYGTEVSMLYDISKQTWSEIKSPAGGCVWHSWIRKGDGFFCMEGKGEAIHRFRLQTGRLEKVVDLRGQRPAGQGSGGWLGIMPDGSPMILKDMGSQELYALELRAQ